MISIFTEADFLCVKRTAPCRGCVSVPCCLEKRLKFVRLSCRDRAVPFSQSCEIYTLVCEVLIYKTYY